MKKLIITLCLGIFACCFNASAQSGVSAQSSVDTTFYKDFVGKYKFKDAPIEEVMVSISNGKLYGEAVGQGAAELKPTTELDIFEVVGFDGKVKFVRNGSMVEKVELTIQGQTLIGEKQP
jgi:hypothetical protein